MIAGTAGGQVKGIIGALGNVLGCNGILGVDVGDNVLSITSRNPDLDAVFGGFDAAKEPKGQSYPGTSEELNGKLAGLPKAEKTPRPNGSATFTLPDGTK